VSGFLGIALALGLDVDYRCTRQPCPVAEAFGEILKGFPGRDYRCECGAPMTPLAPVRREVC
jgi:hypothetical protein